MRPRAGHLGLLALGLAAAFLAGEIGVRLLQHLGALGGEAEAAFPPVAYPVKFRPSRNSRLHWELDPSHPSTNSHGFRDRERDPEKPAGAVRIGVLGDSVTLGRGVPLEATFPAVLETLLAAEDGLAAEVLNFGVGGYNTGQEVEIYARRGRRFDPDLLLLAYVLNDATSAEASLGAMGRARRRDPPPRSGSPPDPPPQSRSPAPAPRAALASPLPLVQSELLELLRERLHALGDDAQVRQHPWLASTYATPESWKIVSGGMGRLATIAREDGDPVLVVIFPLLTDFDDYRFAWIHAQVRREAEGHGFDVLDLLEAFAGRDAGSLRLRPRDTVHLGREGLGLAAHAIRDHLEASGELARLRARAGGYTPPP